MKTFTYSTTVSKAKSWNRCALKLIECFKILYTLNIHTTWYVITLCLSTSSLRTKLAWVNWVMCSNSQNLIFSPCLPDFSVKQSQSTKWTFYAFGPFRLVPDKLCLAATDWQNFLQVGMLVIWARRWLNRRPLQSGTPPPACWHVWCHSRKLFSFCLHWIGYSLSTMNSYLNK